MSKPLSDDEKEKVFGDIVKSLRYINDPAPGEFTVQMVHDVLVESNHSGITKNKIRHRLSKLVDAEVLGKRDINTFGARTNVYFPLRDVSYEEILEILLES